MILKVVNCDIRVLNIFYSIGQPLSGRTWEIIDTKILRKMIKNICNIGKLCCKTDYKFIMCSLFLLTNFLKHLACCSIFANSRSASNFSSFRLSSLRNCSLFKSRYVLFNTLANVLFNSQGLKNNIIISILTKDFGCLIGF